MHGSKNNVKFTVKSIVTIVHIFLIMYQTAVTDICGQIRRSCYGKVVTVNSSLKSHLLFLTVIKIRYFF